MQVILCLFRSAKGQNVLLRLTFGDGQSGVDEHPVGSGDLIQHDLELFNVGKGSPPVKTKSHLGVMASHPADALDNLLQREARLMSPYSSLLIQKGQWFLQS